MNVTTMPPLKDYRDYGAYECNIKKRQPVGTDYAPCVRCGKAICTYGHTLWVVMDEALGAVIDPASAAALVGPNGGWHPIGAECAKKLRDYVVKGD